MGGLQVVEEAFGRPTLRLLHGKYAAVRVAVLRGLFDTERRSIPTDILHVRVGALVDTFRENGIDTPDGTGRELCRNWMRGKWLQRLPAEDGGGEVYELTAAAVDALRIVSDLSSERVLLSESRLTAIVEAVRRQATEASPDVASKVVRIDAEIDRLTAERDRLLAGGEPEPPRRGCGESGRHNFPSYVPAPGVADDRRLSSARTWGSRRSDGSGRPDDQKVLTRRWPDLTSATARAHQSTMVAWPDGKEYPEKGATRCRPSGGVGDHEFNRVGGERL